MIPITEREIASALPILLSAMFHAPSCVKAIGSRNFHSEQILPVGKIITTRIYDGLILWLLQGAK
jgi:hypothetical protein